MRSAKSVYLRRASTCEERIPAKSVYLRRASTCEEVHRSQTDIRRLIERTAALIRPSAQQQGVQIKVEFPGAEIPCLLADATNKLSPDSMSWTMVGIPATTEMEPARIFSPECVVSLSPHLTKAEAIWLLVHSLAAAGHTGRVHVDVTVSALLAREQVATSAIGRGLAFPHLRTRDVPQFCGAVGVSPSGIDFGSLDELPTRLVVLTLSPFEQRSQHCQLLGRLNALRSDRTLQYSLQTPRPAEELLTLLNLT